MADSMAGQGKVQDEPELSSGGRSQLSVQKVWKPIKGKESPLEGVPNG